MFSMVSPAGTTEFQEHVTHAGPQDFEVLEVGVLKVIFSSCRDHGWLQVEKFRKAGLLSHGCSAGKARAQPRFFPRLSGNHHTLEGLVFERRWNAVPSIAMFAT